MKRLLPLIFILLTAACSHDVELNRCYEELPLGTIRPEGWLKETLMRQRDGITANLDETYQQVMGDSNGWLGGEGDRWERGPYWIDGLLPLAYVLDDESLKAKARRWVEWTLASQREDGFFGPDKGYPYIEGLQRGLPLDWWPRIVMLKVMQQYYNATCDERVMSFFDKFFRYQLATLPDTPLDKWTFWARYRAGDNLDVVLWYYSKTHQQWLLDLAELIHSQSFDFTGEFLKGDLLATPGSIHCVNLAQGLKEPVIYWQYKKEQKYLDAIAKGLADLLEFNGFPNGMFGGDEALHGNDPRQGSELCSAVELMFSYEQMLKITGDTSFADELEKVAFNALAAQISDDFKYHQYFQKPNQAQVTLGLHNFDVGQKGTGQVFGFLTAYPCCLSNQHQGWPKFTQNLWYSTRDGGLAALVYSPSTVSATLGGISVRIEEKTAYPYGEDIEFVLHSGSPVSFPLELRIPSWACEASITVNGEQISVAGGITTIKRDWKDGDTVNLHLGMKASASRWFENSVAIERGPLLYALPIGENWKWCSFEGKMKDEFGDGCYEIYATTPWNYGLLKSQVIDHPEEMEYVPGEPGSIKVKAARIPEWQLYQGDAGPLPWSPGNAADANTLSNYNKDAAEEIILIPYGCTKLRISEFPVL